MPLAVLLNLGDPLYTFEHMMQTRQLWAVMELRGYSVLPYLLDPAYDTNIPASKWHLNHQQSHKDFNQALPSYHGSKSSGIPQDEILLDSDLSKTDQRLWWTFSNHWEHFVANNAILPDPSPATYPFW